MKMIADWISDIIRDTKDQVLPEDKLERRESLRTFRLSLGKNARIADTKERVIGLCKHFPLYPEPR